MNRSINVIIDDAPLDADIANAADFFEKVRTDMKVSAEGYFFKPVARS